MDIHEFYATLGNALHKLGEADGAEERARGAERRLSAAETALAGHAEAAAKLKKDADDRLESNRKLWNEEWQKHTDRIEELKKAAARLEDLHKAQSESAGNTLSKLNADISISQKLKAQLDIDINKMRETIHDMAAKL